MCTSLTLKALEHTFFARTMDFAFLLEGKPIFIPSDYEWQLQLGGSLTTTFGFVGTGKQMEEYVFIDGVNEKGLAVAELYFANEAVYSEHLEKGQLNLAPHEFIMWILGHVESIPDLRHKISSVNLVQSELSLLGITIPLHFIVTDPSGECVVVETNRGFIEVKDNPVGVMTNSPDFAWHLKNLSNYLSASPAQVGSKKVNGFEVNPFGLGNGSSILPGGWTSPERFVRTVYNKQFVEVGQTVSEVINSLFHLLNNVTIPKGVMLEPTGESEYTQYRAVFDLKNCAYYYNPYETQDVYLISLDEALLQLKKPHTFEIDSQFKPKSVQIGQ